jgi:AraC-like DNA-binding protein
MAFTKPYQINFSAENGIQLEFLHEIIQTPLDKNDSIFETPDGFNPPHSQNYCELIFFNSGSRDIRVGDSQYFLSAGDILAVRPGEKHCGRSRHCILDRYYIHIYPNALSHLKDGGCELTAVFFERKEYTNNIIKLPFNEQKHIRELLMAIDNTLRFGAYKTKDAEAYAYIICILSTLNNYMKDNTAGKKSKNELLLNILSYIENSYDSNSVITDILKHFGVSRSTLWRLFKSEINTTPMAYLQKVRLENARILLAKDIDVMNVSLMCGFSDCSHFIRRFKQKFGMTPLQYKKNRQKK